MQGRPWQQGNQGQGNKDNKDRDGKDRDRDGKDNKGGQNWGQGWNQGQNWGQGQAPNWPPGQNWGQGFGGSGGSAGDKGDNKPQGGNKPQENPNRNKGDSGSLSRATRGAQNFRNKPQRTIAAPTTGPGLNVYNGLRTRGNAKNAARDMASLWGSNSEAAANALTSAATSGSDRIGVAEAVAATTVAAPNVAPGGLRRNMLQHLWYQCLVHVSVSEYPAECRVA